MEITKSNKKGLLAALKLLREGKSVVYPTDTAYGLGVDALNQRAVRTIYKIKSRNFRKPVHVIIGGLPMAKRYVETDAISERLFRNFFPGPLALVLPLKKKLPAALKLLAAGTNTLGVRMPDHAIALNLVRRLGRPITATSANLSGGPTPYSITAASRQFRGKVFRPDLYLDAGRLPRRPPSTLVSIKKRKIKILRPGPVSEKQIRKCIT